MENKFFKKRKKKEEAGLEEELTQEEAADSAPAQEVEEEDIIMQDERQEEEDEVEVSSSGPEIASASRNKLVLVGASSLFITAVIYFMFFKGEEVPKDNLEPVAPIIRPTGVARDEGGKSPFEIEPVEKKAIDDVALLEKPKAPDIPKLPELTAEEKKEGLLSLQDLAKKDVPQNPENLAQLPIIPQDQRDSQLSQNQPLQGQKLEAPPVQLGGVANAAGGAANQLNPSYVDPKYAPIVVMSAPGQGQGKDGKSLTPSLGVGYDKNIVMLNGDPIGSLEKSAVETKTTFVDGRQNVVAQGKMLTAVLETAINTELPGFVRAVVSRDVYGEAGNDVLISRGSRLFGSYSSEITRGQGRVQINWTRLIRPDGVDLALSSYASDQFGRAGIQGDVDNRYGSIIAGSILTSILTVAAAAAAEQLINTDTQATTTTNPQQGTTTTTGGASNQAIFNVTKTLTDTVGRVVNERLDTRPVITVPQGTRITVIVNADMKIPSIRK